MWCMKATDFFPYSDSQYVGICQQIQCPMKVFHRLNTPVTLTELCRNHATYYVTKFFVYWNSLTGVILHTVSNKYKLLQMGIWGSKLKTLKTKSHICVHIRPVPCLNTGLDKMECVMTQVQLEDIAQNQSGTGKSSKGRQGGKKRR